MPINKDNKANTAYSHIAISLASPEQILDQSSG